MFARVALLYGFLVSCSGATPAASIPAPPPPPPPLPLMLGTETASPPPEVQAPAEAEPEPPARTELVLSDEQVRDITVRFDSAACTSSEGTELEIEVRIDDESRDTFTITTDNAPASCNEYGRKVEMGDYNFDGHEDLAVPVDNAGSYWGPTFAILLYQPLNGHYVEAPLLSALTRENLGLFQVDAKRKLLTIYNKSGCCIHYKSDVSVGGDVPTVVSSELESIIYEHDTCRVVLERTLTNGKTKTTTRRCKKAEQL
jgi:hypothetical protein